MKNIHRLLDPRKPADIGAGVCALAVMTKAPRPGQVKTRLTPPLTPEEAAALSACFLRDTTASIARTTRAARVVGVAVYMPVGSERTYIGILPDDFMLLPQRGETLSERLILAVEDLFALGFESICLINSDSPTVAQESFFRAAQFLAGCEDGVVIGPTEDGGYYLIGLNKTHRALFEEIEWSTERVFQQTLAKARQLGLEIQLLPQWYDVDDRAALRQLCRELFTASSKTPEANPAPATRGLLEALLQNEGRQRIWPDE